MRAVSFALLLALSPAATRADPAGTDGIVLPPVVMRVGAFGAPCTHATLQAALTAASTSGSTEIRLANNQLYNGINVNISGRNVSVIGGYTDCAGNTADPNQRTRLTGAVGGADSVIEIIGGATERTLLLRNLEIVGGEEDLDGGGGVEIDGSAMVTLDNVRIRDNVSSTGGGLHISGATNPVAVFVTGGDLWLGTGNSADDGGGVFCEDASINVVGAALVVATNTVTGNGGGALLDDCNLTIGELGVDDASLLVISNHSGSQGGGIWAANGSLVTLRGQGHQFLSNDTRTRGGGIYLDGPTTRLFADAVSFIDNSVAENDPIVGFVADGGAVAVVNGAGADFDGGLPQPCDPITWDGVDWQACVLFYENSVTATAPNASRNGSAIFVDDGQLRVRQARFNGNLGVGGVVHAEDTAEAIVESSVFDHNADAYGVFAGSAAQATVAFSTFVDAGSVASMGAFGDGTVLSVHNTAWYLTPAPAIAVDSDATVQVSCAAGIAAGGIPVVGSVNDDDFMDAGGLDYRPSAIADNELVDRCTNVPFAPTIGDARGVLRPVDDDQADDGGTYDIGAYERVPEILFADSFEN